MFVFAHFRFRCPQKPSAASLDHMTATVYNYQLGGREKKRLEQLINKCVTKMWEQHLKCIRYGKTTDQRCANILNQMTFLSCSGYYIKDYFSPAVQYFSKGPAVKSRLLSKSNWKQILMREPIPGTIPWIKPMVHKCVTAVTLQDWAKARCDSSAWHNQTIRLQADCVRIGMTNSPNSSQKS